jgi:hypothetical protein
MFRKYLDRGDGSGSGASALRDKVCVDMIKVLVLIMEWEVRDVWIDGRAGAVA